MIGEEKSGIGGGPANIRRRAGVTFAQLFNYALNAPEDFKRKHSRVTLGEAAQAFARVAGDSGSEG